MPSAESKSHGSYSKWKILSSLEISEIQQQPGLYLK